MKEVFRVVKKEDHGVIREVYDVRNDNCGYPHFLIYENGEWKYVSAKHFVPYSDILKEEISKNFAQEMKFISKGLMENNKILEKLCITN